MYIHHDLVKSSFKRLRCNSAAGHEGKVHMERTSSLMFMLAFDEVARTSSVNVLDISVDSFQGKMHRRSLALAYERLVSIGSSNAVPRKSVYELGSIHLGGNTPANRISSNFMTTKVKQSRSAVEPFAYPGRPAPLLLLGPAATGVVDGIMLHPEWQGGMQAHLSDVESNTPFTDLAIFCLRSASIAPGRSLQDVLANALAQIYSSSLASFWSASIRNERLLATHLNSDHYLENTYVDALSTIFAEHEQRRLELMNLRKETLVDMILALENN